MKKNRVVAFVLSFPLLIFSFFTLMKNSTEFTFRTIASLLSVIIFLGFILLILKKYKDEK